MESEFGVEVREEEDGATVIVVTGELDLASSPALEEELQRAFGSESRLVILDLRELEFMDSTGLSVIVKAHQAAAKLGKRLCLVKGPPQVQRLLNLTGVAERLTVVDAPGDARAGD